MNSDQDDLIRRLDEVHRYLEEQSQTFVGYQCSSQFDYEPIFRFLRFPINNVGDPFTEGSFRVNSKQIEREVLSWFAELTSADREAFWGYVTNGGTEGNLYGLYLARELMPEGLVYYSEETHYSVRKSIRLLKMPSITIRTQKSGEVDYDDLRETIRIHRDRPPIIFANIGTTMTQAIDDVARIRQMIQDLAISEYYIHCDAAFSGMILPFVEDPPAWDFSTGIDSMAISGHKFIGSPLPCGVVLARRANVDRIARSIEYVGTLDTTISGSRSGITPLMLWYAIHKHGRSGFAAMVERCMQTADYAVAAFQAAGVPAWRNRHSLTVVFPKPHRSILDKWQIAVHKDIAHMIVMQQIDRKKIDEFVADIKDSQEPKVAS